MRTSDVPRILRESPEVARAREEGERVGRAGVAADQNPWREKSPEMRAGIFFNAAAHQESPVEHAIGNHGLTLCNAGGDIFDAGRPFLPKAPWACKRCIRAVEAERKRRATAWEEGRLSTHPK